VVRVAESEPVPEEPSEPFVWHPLPLKIQVDSLKVADLDVAVPGVTITLKDLDIGAALDRAGLIVRGPVLDGLNVVVAPSPVEAASDKGAKPADEKSATLAVGEGKAVPGDKTQAASKPEPMVLPAVRLPFPIQLEGLKATAFRYQQGELVEGLDNLLLSATAEEERIDIRELSLRHAMADLALSGQVRLHEDYPSP
jgi:translocation and assembly module TamB